MRFVNATALDRKSGVAEWRDLRFLLMDNRITFLGGPPYSGRTAVG
jgi:hypothetical protein